MKTYHLQCSDDTHKSGDVIEAGLPNITGSFSATDNVCLNGIANTDHPLVFRATSGCFSSVNGNGARAMTQNIGVASPYGDSRTVNFNAGNSNAIYGKSDTVQPYSVVLNVWRRVS